MSHPAIVCVDDDRISVDRLREELTKRYAADYDVVVVSSADEARQVLGRLGEQGAELALVMAAGAMTDTADILTEVRAASPSTRRTLLVTAGSRPMQAAVQQAAALGLMHSWLLKPLAPGLVEEFHHGVSDALYSWSAEERPFEYVRVVGEAWSASSHAVRDLLARNRVPFGFYDAATGEGERLLQRLGVTADRLPVVAIGDTDLLVQPTVAVLADALGGQTRPRDTCYDVVIVGAGPAGLGAAVYGASEGLSTVVLEREAIGGQAGTSSLIRNYLGFPMGISGSELALRAFHQAMLFGTEFIFANRAVGLTATDSERVITLADGGEVRGRTVVIASGVSWRRLEIPALEAQIGAGVYYGAATTEAEAVAGLEVCVVGGGNSAGQAALKLAQHAEHVTLLVRGPSLAESMSEYLIRDLERSPRVSVRFNCEVIGCTASRGLHTLSVRDVVSGREDELACRALFVMIGAEPTTDWLPPTVARDRWGYILTGADAATATGTPASPFATSLPRVFAVGDVRHGSIKRVVSAAAEGSVCIRSIHEELG